MEQVLNIKDWLVNQAGDKQFEFCNSAFGSHAKRLSDGRIFYVGEEVLFFDKFIICRIQYFVKPGNKLVNVISGSLRISVPINSLQKMC